MMGIIKMTSQEILTKAIEKAYQNGWGYWNLKDQDFDWSAKEEIDYHFDKAERADPNGGDLAYWSNIIFNHDFAKALWGDLPGTIARHVDENGQQRDGQVILEWQFHLQQMVIADDPIKYLGENI